MGRDAVVKQLRQLESVRASVARLEAALDGLGTCEREIIEKMYIHPVEKASDKICEKFDIEVASVYRRRNKALKKLEYALMEVG